MCTIQTGAVHTEYYHESDFCIGAAVNVWGRKAIVCDCDEFTKNFYRTKYGIGNSGCGGVWRGGIGNSGCGGVWRGGIGNSGCGGVWRGGIGNSGCGGVWRGGIGNSGCGGVWRGGIGNSGCGGEA